MKLGQQIRDLREKKGLLLREVAAQLKIDTAMISKIERGEKPCKKEHLVTLSKLLDISEKELKSIWLAEKILDIVRGESFASKAIELAQKELKNDRNRK